MPDTRNALARLKQKINANGKRIISAWLRLMFSAVEHQTLDDMIKTLDNPMTLKRNLD